MFDSLEEEVVRVQSWAAPAPSTSVLWANGSHPSPRSANTSGETWLEDTGHNTHLWLVQMMSIVARWAVIGQLATILSSDWLTGRACPGSPTSPSWTSGCWPAWSSSSAASSSSSSSPASTSRGTRGTGARSVEHYYRFQTWRYVLTNVTLIMFLLLVLVRVSLQDSSAHSLRHLQLPVLAHTPHWILWRTLSLSDLHLQLETFSDH